MVLLFWMQGKVEEPALAPPAKYMMEIRRLSLIEKASLDSKLISTLKVKNLDTALLCDEDSDISIEYTIAGETQGFVNVMYLVSR